MGKVKRITGAVLKGIVKALPLSAYLNDAKNSALQSEVKKVEKRNLLTLPTRERIALFTILDVLDDGKINQSVNEFKVAKLIEIGVSIATIITLIKSIL